MTHTVAGLFDRRRSADLVVEHLVQEYGIPRERVRVFGAGDGGAAEARSPQDSDQEASLAELGLPEERVRALCRGHRTLPRIRGTLLPLPDGAEVHAGLRECGISPESIEVGVHGFLLAAGSVEHVPEVEWHNRIGPVHPHSLRVPELRPGKVAAALAFLPTLEHFVGCLRLLL